MPTHEKSDTPAPAPDLAPAVQLQQLLDATNEGIYALNREGYCIWANPASARILGYASPVQFVGKLMHNLIHHTRPDGSHFPAEECDGLARLKAGQGVVQPDELLWRADGTSFHAEVHVNAFEDHGEVTGAVVAISDITERLHLEDQVRHAHKMEAIGRLAAGMAHDFNNLLTVVNGYAELLERDNANQPNIAQKAHSIRRAGQRAAELTRQLLAFSRQQLLQPQSLDLNEMVQALEAAVRNIAGEKIAVTIGTEANLPPVWADPGRIEQILFDLVANACDAMPDGGRLEINTAKRPPVSGAVAPGAAGWRRPEQRELPLPAGEAPPPQVALIVRDTGIGMDQETQRRIFDPFFSTKPRTQASGMGLAAVLGTVQQSGGTVTVESLPGVGTTMTIYLPTGSRGAPESSGPAGLSQSRGGLR